MTLRETVMVEIAKRVTISDLRASELADVTDYVLSVVDAAVFREREACLADAQAVADAHFEQVRRRTPANGRADAEMRSGALQVAARIGARWSNKGAP